MSGIAVISIIVAVVLISIVAIYINQAKERAKVERLQKITSLNDRNEKLQSLLNNLPPQYLGKELRALVLNKSIETLQQLVELKPGKRFEADLESTQEYLQKLMADQVALKPVAIKDPAKAKEVRSLLEILYKFVHQQAKLKKIDTNSAKQYLASISFSAAKCHADALVIKADNASKAGKPRVAIHAYHSAIECFKNLKQHPQAIELIKAYKAKIKTLESQADQHTRKLKRSLRSKWKAAINGINFLMTTILGRKRTLTMIDR